MSDAPKHHTPDPDKKAPAKRKGAPKVKVEHDEEHEEKEGGEKVKKEIEVTRTAVQEKVKPPEEEKKKNSMSWAILHFLLKTVLLDTFLLGRVHKKGWIESLKLRIGRLAIIWAALGGGGYAGYNAMVEKFGSPEIELREYDSFIEYMRDQTESNAGKNTILNSIPAEIMAELNNFGREALKQDDPIKWVQGEIKAGRFPKFPKQEQAKLVGKELKTFLLVYGDKE